MTSTDNGSANDEKTVGTPQPDPTKTDHPTGDDQAKENQETESPA